jgi:3-oxoacyl-[acyl-carrier protein] reductase
MINLRGKVVLITGASRGIGAACAVKFAEAGADVVVNYFQNEKQAAQVAAEARSRGVRAFAAHADVARFDEVREMFDRTVNELGRLDVLVANAGIWKGAPIDQMEQQTWAETIAINLTGVYNCCHLAARIMKKQRSGRIITVTSTAGQRGEAYYSNYAASKGGVISFTKSLAAELGPCGITVNSVAPGWVDTDMAAEALGNPAELQKITSIIPVGRVATAEECAGPIVFLASDLANHINGEVLNVNGGSVLCG